MRLLKELSAFCLKFRDVLFVLAGIFVFALYIHQDTWLIVIAFTGLILAALGISFFIVKQTSISRIFGSDHFSKRSTGYIFLGIIIGGAVGLFYRYTFLESLLPVKLTGFALIAPCIGISEELLFRGYIQGRIRSSGRIVSVVIASIAHTTYKFLVLRSLPDPSGIDFSLLITWTMIVGLIFGTLRELSNTILSPSLAHGCFDVIVYGGFASAPIWVWG